MQIIVGTSDLRQLGFALARAGGLRNRIIQGRLFSTEIIVSTLCSIAFPNIIVAKIVLSVVNVASSSRLQVSVSIAIPVNYEFGIFIVHIP